MLLVPCEEISCFLCRSCKDNIISIIVFTNFQKVREKAVKYFPEFHSTVQFKINLGMMNMNFLKNGNFCVPKTYKNISKMF